MEERHRRPITPISSTAVARAAPLAGARGAAVGTRSWERTASRGEEPPIVVLENPKEGTAEQRRELEPHREHGCWYTAVDAQSSGSGELALSAKLGVHHRHGHIRTQLPATSSKDVLPGGIIVT